ncbi:MAG: phosphoenolpyruvate carboxykinase (ATP), partial [Candidatus Omnitrophica bacterium]|nr:phosphoenolpyruvate carboxykinase (ATP) [Candidatus Omnitrophota bacterium]
FIIVHFGKKLVLIGGTSYAGEIKKSVFTIMNYLLPLERVLPMHCAANVGSSGEVAIFFGLSGTGKTSLSADSRRTLIGDDEHGWSDRGVFNFENGCYAKMIRLSPAAEPEIYATTHYFGTLLENVTMDPKTRALDLDDDSLTENTRGAYPLTMIPNASQTKMAGHPSNVLMLTCDAFGVMPPIAKLTPEQAMYHFISGYTAKVAGTEKGIKEPSATFSACFGAPFMALRPAVYAGLLGEKLAKHRATCWLINTGWTGGPYGTGNRIAIGATRAMVDAALTGALAQAPTAADPIFGLARVTRCPGVDDGLLDPRSTWNSAAAYDAKAKALAAKFRDNFVQFADEVPSAVRHGGPAG